jgi:serine/threonine-protein phosphatase 5
MVIVRGAVTVYAWCARVWRARPLLSESTALNLVYGFTAEVQSKYPSMHHLFTHLFHQLPLAAVLRPAPAPAPPTTPPTAPPSAPAASDGPATPPDDRGVLVLHGGLFSNERVNLDELRRIHRTREPPEQGPMAELLWSDPMVMPGRAPNPRGIALLFGPGAPPHAPASRIPHP